MNGTTKEMLTLATKTMHNAYAPYSKFHVGACIRATDGQLYVGCNVENLSYSLTLCAETSAIAAMIANGSKRIAELVLIVSSDKISTPCGACRQRIHEFAENLMIPIHCFNNQGESKIYTIGELLPDSFEFDAK